MIPDQLLGRVNSVYRFFGWGMMPIGAALGGLIVVATDAVASRELALRMPWLVYGAASIMLLAYAGPRLTTAAFAAARRPRRNRPPRPEVERNMELSDALDFIRDKRNGTLIALKSDGRPQSSNIAFALGDDDVIRISVTDGRSEDGESAT